MVDIRQDTETVKREFDGMSTPTQVFIWSLVALGVLLGLLLGGVIGYGVSVEEIEGRECIEHEGIRYCADENGQARE